MSCLRVDEVYSYLEGELSSGATRMIEDHLDSCPRCREAVEERRILAHAADSLPRLEAPSDFSQRVMAAIFPAKILLLSWLGGLGFWLSSVLLFLTVFLMTTGRDGVRFLFHLNENLWAALKNAALFFARLAALLSAFSTLLEQIGEGLLKTASAVTGLPGAPVAFLVLGLTILFLFGLIFGAGKRYLFGEKP